MKNTDIDLFLFYSNIKTTCLCIDAGVDGVIIDLETKGKNIRQQHFDTQINKHSIDDLRKLKMTSDVYTLLRINGFPYYDQSEISQALDNGVNEILLPMVRRVEEVETVLNFIKGRCNLGILVETEEAIANSKFLSELPLSRVFVGLNDLNIDRKGKNLFLPLADGTVEELKNQFAIPFGFAGLTHPNLGDPIPSYLLMHKMHEMGISYTFLRRSFYQSLNEYSVKEVIDAIKEKFTSFNSMDHTSRARNIDLLKQNIMESSGIGTKSNNEAPLNLL